ncbi:hypothetical protein AURDEDRAFT_170484 [Auricularia subglabra TFB-10046 SS5]|nr:hypothetical protein AURDEDRAFT_170484 [Auricularia subglabra TFB-10046 SS5]
MHHSTYALLFLLLVSHSNSAPTIVPHSKSASTIESQGIRLIEYRPYNDIQISHTVGGTAYAEASAVFVSPFAGVALSGVSYADFDAVMLMAEAAEDADFELFAPAVASAENLTIGDALEVGRVKNKVLQLTGVLQAMKIKLARRRPVAEDPLWDIYHAVRDTLDEYVEMDAANAGLPSLGLLYPTDS